MASLRKAFEVLVVATVSAFSQVPGPITGAIRHVHDPAVMRCGEAYYLYSTGTGIPIRRSVDLAHWESVGTVFREEPAWFRAEVPGFKDHIWAPDISLLNGKYHLYYSISTFGKNRSCIGLAVNATLDPTSPDYRWEDKGKVIESRPGKTNWNAIDPNLFIDEDGRSWLLFGSFWSGIKLVEVDPEHGKPSSSPPELVSLARRTSPTSIEAPFLIRRGSFYYLFVSFDQCCRGSQSTYKTMVGRAERVTGPYVDRTGKAMMDGGATLMLASHGDCRGPGHNAVLRTDAGDWLVHHMYDASLRGMRTLQIRPIIWDTDGWPLPGEPGVKPVPADTTLVPTDLVGTWEHSVNFGSLGELRLLANGRISDADSPNTWTVADGRLTLRWANAEAPGGAWVDECHVSADGRTYVGRNQGGALIRGTRP